MTAQSPLTAAPPDTVGWRVRLAMLVAFTCTWFFINGYAFGSSDHSIHLGFLLREMDPSLLKGDPLMEIAANHPSLFWKLQVPLLRLMPVEVLYALIHVLSVVMMLAGTAALARALYPVPHSDWVAALAMAAVLIPRHYAGIPLLDEIVLNRTVSMGPLLFALVLGAKRRYHAAFALVGLVFLIHPTTAAHAAILLGVLVLFDRERRRVVLTGPLVCMLAASPLLVPMVRHRVTAGVPFPPPEEWVLLTRVQVSWHHYPSDWDGYVWLHMLATVLVLAAALRMRRSRPVELYLLGIALTFAAGTFCIEVLHLPTAQHLHLLEVLRFLPYLTAACGAQWVLETWPWPSHPERKWSGLAPAAAYFGFLTGLTLVTLGAMVAVLLLRPGSRGPLRAPRVWVPLALAVAFAPVVYLLRIYVYAAPVRFIPRLDMYKGGRMMEWSRQNLPQDALVVLPPFFQPWEEWHLAFRFGAQRATFTTYKDGAEGSFNLAFMLDWKQRMEALCGCQLFEPLAAESSDGQAWYPRVLEMRRVLREGYRTADAARLRGLAARYGATHAVVESDVPHPPDLPLLYADDEYRVYRLTP